MRSIKECQNFMPNYNDISNKKKKESKEKEPQKKQPKNKVSKSKKEKIKINYN